jgi:signal transduction histidine kinase/ligand-binding sensor domain-containing protein/AraC-like DNA-binding protein
LILIAGQCAWSQSTARLFTRLNITHPEAPTFVNAITQDQKGFMWIGSTDGLFRFDGYEFRAFRHNPADSLSLKSNNISALFVDKAGNIWVGAAGAVQRLDPQTRLFYQPDLGAASIQKMAENTVKHILEDQYGQIWIATDRLGLLRHDPASGQNRVFQHLSGDSTSRLGNSVWGIAEDPAGALWVAGLYGIYRYDPVEENFIRIPFEAHDRDPQGNILSKNLRGLAAPNPGELWVSTDGGGVYRRDPATGAWTGFHHDPADPESIGGSRTTLIYPDREKKIWIASVTGGLNRFDAERQSFVRYKTSAAEINSISDDHVYAIFEDRNGLIWVGTSRGIDILHPRNTQFEFHQREENKEQTLNNDNIYALLEDRNGEIWIGTRSAGLNRYHPQSRTYESYRHNPSDPGSLANDVVWSIHEDRRGRLWIGTSGGVLNLFDSTTDRFTRFPLPIIESHVFNDQIRSITEDEQGRLWLATLGSGLYSFDPESRSMQVYRNEKGNEKSLSSNAVFAIEADQDGGLWVATIHGGVCYFDLTKQTFTRYAYAANGPPNQSFADNFALFIDRRQRIWVGSANARLGLYDPAEDDFKYFLGDRTDASYVIMGITDDARGNLWLTTNRGLLRFTPPEDLYAPESRGDIQLYTREDGLQDNDFNTGAVFQSRTGEIYVGGTKGFNRFHPDSLLAPQTGPEVILTDFQVFNHSAPIARNEKRAAKEFSLNQDIAYTESMTLTHRQRVFSIEFTAADYDAPNQNRYAYRMEGFTPDWTDLGVRHAVTFTNLDPGTYTLQVKAANRAGIWSDKIRSLQLIITPPWYRTWAAYLIFATLTIGAIYLIYQFNLRRRLKAAEVERVLEMNTLKSRLYTNITHEFRTPLTVIMGMTDNILGHRREKELIQRNSKNLLRLINQLLDLSKLEAGSMDLNPVQADIIAYLQYLAESFYSMAGEKEIRLTFYPEEDALIMDFDEVKIQHIVYNLLSNALKFTPAGGKVIFHVQKDERNGIPHLKLKVKDTGSGISPEQLPHIFDRFFQVDNSATRRAEGTGIGLTLTKELVELMKGRIMATSTVGQGSEFIVWLPISNEASLAAPAETPRKKEVSWVDTGNTPTPAMADFPFRDQDRPELLIIEDNRDVVTYIRTLLEKDYAIYTANNGQTGIEQALERTPDIIICDVMMPEKNGYEVCETLKNDERTSHIPIILLTAKADQDARITGLKSGADAHLTKPFNREELMIRLEKLVQLRKELQSKYQAFSFDPVSPPKAPTKEELFLIKLQAVIEERLDDPDLGVAQLCRAVELSHMQVYRKLKALTGKTPSVFIRTVRLQHARKLLQTTDLNVSEVAYAVGFADPGYFSKTFFEEFGVRPNVIRK